MSDRTLERIFGIGQPAQVSKTSGHSKLVTGCAIVSVFICCFSMFTSFANQRKTETFLRSAESMLEQIKHEKQQSSKLNSSRPMFQRSVWDKEI